VVVNHIHNHRDARLVEGVDHRAKFLNLRGLVRILRVLAGRSKIVYGHVTPAIFLGVDRVEFMDGLKLHRIDAQLTQVAATIKNPFT